MDNRFRILIHISSPVAAFLVPKMPFFAWAILPPSPPLRSTILALVSSPQSNSLLAFPSPNMKIADENSWPDFPTPRS